MEIWAVTDLIEEDRPLSLEFFLPPFLLTWGEMSYVDKTFFDVGAGYTTVFNFPWKCTTFKPIFDHLFQSCLPHSLFDKVIKRLGRVS